MRRLSPWPNIDAEPRYYDENSAPESDSTQRDELRSAARSRCLSIGEGERGREIRKPRGGVRRVLLPQEPRDFSGPRATSERGLVVPGEIVSARRRDKSGTPVDGGVYGGRNTPAVGKINSPCLRCARPFA